MVFENVSSPLTSQTWLTGCTTIFTRIITSPSVATEIYQLSTKKGYNNTCSIINEWRLSRAQNPELPSLLLMARISMVQPSPAPPALADDSPCEHKIRRNTTKSGSDKNSAVAEISSLNKGRVLFFFLYKVPNILSKLLTRYLKGRTQRQIGHKARKVQ